MYNLVVLAQQGHILPLSIYNSFNVSHHEEQDVVVEKILKRYFLKSMKCCDMIYDYEYYLELLIGLYSNGTCKLMFVCFFLASLPKLRREVLFQISL